jgi:hypothetical protein
VTFYVRLWEQDGSGGPWEGAPKCGDRTPGQVADLPERRVSGPCTAVCSVRDEEAARSNPIWNQSGEWALAATRLGIGAICDEGTQIGSLIYSRMCRCGRLVTTDGEAEAPRFRREVYLLAMPGRRRTHPRSIVRHCGFAVGSIVPSTGTLARMRC